MARNDDIRIYLGEVFTDATLSSNLNFLKTLLNEDVSGPVAFGNKVISFEIVNEKIIIDNKTFVVNDINKVISEFTLLKEKFGDILYTDIFFKKGTYPEKMMFTERSKSILNAKLYAGAMRRAYNWHRYGSNTPIYISHHAGSKIIASVVLGSISYRNGEPVVEYTIIQNDEIIHHSSIHFPYLIKTQAASDKHTSKITSLKAVTNFVKDINKENPDITLKMIEKIAVALNTYQNNTQVVTVTMELTTAPGGSIIGINDPAIGGVVIKEGQSDHHLNNEPILLQDLISGLPLYSESLEQEQDSEVNVVELTKTSFDSLLRDGKHVYQQLLGIIQDRIVKSHLSFSYLEAKGIKVRYKSWVRGKPYYSIEVSTESNNIYIFDYFFNLNQILIEAGINKVTPNFDNFFTSRNSKESIFGKIKNIFGRVFA